jgi:ketosteroid isomerase-like protein
MTIGLGWHRLARPSGQAIVWHNEGMGGYHAFLGFDPARGAGVVVLTNWSAGLDDLGFHLLDPDIPLAPPPRPDVEAAPGSLVLEPDPGEYEMRFPARADHLPQRAAMRGFLLISLTTVSATPVAAQASGDSAAVAAVVTRFHAALAGGDSAAALAVLAPDVVIVESGGVETRDQYRSGHLAGDIRFASATTSRRGPIRVVLQGEVAWASSTAEVEGTYRDRAINSVSAELMVLARGSSGWLIRAIHWSTRQRRPAGG